PAQRGVGGRRAGEIPHCRYGRRRRCAAPPISRATPRAGRNHRSARRRAAVPRPPRRKSSRAERDSLPRRRPSVAWGSAAWASSAGFGRDDVTARGGVPVAARRPRQNSSLPQPTDKPTYSFADEEDRVSEQLGNDSWNEFFALIRTIDVPEDFMAERPMNAPPVERLVFDDCEQAAGIKPPEITALGATAIAAGLLHCPIMTERRDLFPPIEPHRSGRLRLDARHVMYWEESGNPHGAPLLFLHGGPGAGATAVHRRFFDPAYWRIVIFDQRGGGRSTPVGEVRDNSPDHLVGDIEQLRQELGIAEWLIFGGSWGSTLALHYAENHPERVSGLILRGIFLCRAAEIDWFLYGARTVFPEAWRAFAGFLPEDEREDLLAG